MSKMNLSARRRNESPPVEWAAHFLPVVQGGYGTIVSDPPWRFQDRGSRIAPRYLVLEDRDIVSMPVRQLASKDAHLYLWTTDSHLPLALTCVDAWGFRFKQTLVWVKTRDGGRLQIGMGHYYRHAHELCLFATRGRAPFEMHNLPSVILAPRSSHSVKPERLQDLADLVSPSPRLELFARRKRLGWSVWGNEA